jgi:hypothetical protein
MWPQAAQQNLAGFGLDTHALASLSVSFVSMYSKCAILLLVLNLSNTTPDAVYQTTRRHTTEYSKFHGHRRATVPFSHTI